MEMPVPCNNCGEWVELNSSRTSPITKELVCRSCYQEHELQYEEENKPKYECAECGKALTEDSVNNCCGCLEHFCDEHYDPDYAMCIFCKDNMIEGDI